MKCADGVEGPVEVGPHGGSPVGRIDRDRPPNGALRPGAGHQPVDFRPDGENLARGGLHLRPIGDITAAGMKRPAGFADKGALVGTGESPDVESVSQQSLGERATNP